MGQFRFACPNCSQHIACDDQWCGHEIQCPICQGNLIVPQSQPQPPTPPPAPPHRGLPPPPPGAKTRAGAGKAKEAQKGQTAKIAKVSTFCFIGLVAGYFFFAWLVKM